MAGGQRGSAPGRGDTKFLRRPSLGGRSGPVARSPLGPGGGGGGGAPWGSSPPGSSPAPAGGCRGRWRPRQRPPPRPAAISRDYPKHSPVAARLPPGIGAAGCQSGRRPAAPGLRRATETSRGGGRHSPGAGPRRAAPGEAAEDGGGDAAGGGGAQHPQNLQAAGSLQRPEDLPREAGGAGQAL